MKFTIVGGGFGGVKAALELAKNKSNKITLITDKPDFQYYPACMVLQLAIVTCSHGCHSARYSQTSLILRW